MHATAHFHSVLFYVCYGEPSWLKMLLCIHKGMCHKVVAHISAASQSKLLSSVSSKGNFESRLKYVSLSMDLAVETPGPGVAKYA